MKKINIPQLIQTYQKSPQIVSNYYFVYNSILSIICIILIMPSFVQDDKGNTTHVLLTIEEYEELLEDLEDLKIIVERRGEETVSHEELKEKYK